MVRGQDSAITDDQRHLQHRAIKILQNKLEDATRMFSKLVVKPGPAGTVRKLKFSLVSEAFNEAISALEDWQRRYEPSWFQLIKLAPPEIDVELNRAIRKGSSAVVPSAMVARQFRRAFKNPSEASQSVFIDGGALAGCKKTVIPFSTATVATVPTVPTCPATPQRLIVDVVTPGAVERKDARSLAFRLRDADPATFGLLSCKGVLQGGTQAHEMAFLLRIPDGFTRVSSVRQLLLSGRAHDSLSHRLEMARRLATAVYYVHLYGFVHKNIRPETILSLGSGEEDDDDDGPPPHNAFLVGYQVVRDADGRTRPAADCTPETNLYRHPQRWGNDPEYFSMQHDIYSLGVCLLEIGLWESFVSYDDANGVARLSQDALGDLSTVRDPGLLKDRLVQLSKGAGLRGRMGDKYSRVVETCLTCLDKDNMDFGDDEEFVDEDGVVVGARYIEKILGVLELVSI